MSFQTKLEAARKCYQMLLAREAKADESTISKARAARLEMQMYISQLHRDNRMLNQK